MIDAVDHMRNTPKAVSGIGAFNAAEMPSASTLRVSRGSIMPSSNSITWNCPSSTAAPYPSSR